MDRRNLPIGVFDSGVGGLTVAREIFRNLPDENIIYYGDTARVPYGNKSRETIIRYSKQIIQFLISRGVKAVVIACNTASSLALEAVQETVEIPVIGVVIPGANAAVQATHSGRIGIIGTSATISSGIYDRYIRELRPDAQVFGKACPLFVHLVEENMIDDPVTREMIHRYLDEMIQKDNIDTLILGCTHYPLLRNVIAEEIGGEPAGADNNTKSTESSDAIRLVNPAYTTAMELAALLKEQGLDSGTPARAGSHQFYVSDDPDSFQAFASRVLHMEIAQVQQKVLE